MTKSRGIGVMNKIDINRASVETLQAYFDARLANRDTQTEMAAIVAECEVKLRTRAEVDAQILVCIRAHCEELDRLEEPENRDERVPNDFNARWLLLRSLCAEPVTDDAPEQDECAHEDGDCSDAEALIERLDETLCSLLHRGDEEGEHSPHSHQVLASELQGGLSITEARAKIAKLERAWDSLIDTGATLRADNERFARELLDARNRVAELEEFHLRVCDMLDYVNRADGQGGYECAPNKLIFDEIARLKDVPCERRHLTEAEEALCHYVDTRVVPWDTHTYGGFADYLNAVRNERRKQTTGHVLSPEQHAGIGAGGGDEDDPQPERCSCEEAERLREAGKLALAFLSGCDFLPEGEADKARAALRKALS